MQSVNHYSSSRPTSTSTSTPTSTSSSSTTPTRLSIPTSNLPRLSLSTSIRSQRRHELNHQRPSGHTCHLASALAIASLKHILYARGQLDQPIAIIESNRNKELKLHENEERRSGDLGTKAVRNSNKRKRDQLLDSISNLSHHLNQACKTLSTLESSACSPSNHPDPDPSNPTSTSSSTSTPSRAKDLSLLLLLGPTPQVPKDLFAISIESALAPPPPALSLSLSEGAPQPHAKPLEQGEILIEQSKTSTSISNDQEKQRKKTQTSLEQKLVRFMINDERVEEMSSAVAPTRAHILLLAPESFNCPGWIPKRNIDVDMSGFQPPESSPQETDLVTQEQINEYLSSTSTTHHPDPSSLPDPSLRSSSPSIPKSSSNSSLGSDFISERPSILDRTSHHHQSPSSGSVNSNHGVGSGSEGGDDLDIARMSVLLSPLKKRPVLPPRTQSSSSASTKFRELGTRNVEDSNGLDKENENQERLPFSRKGWEEKGKKENGISKEDGGSNKSLPVLSSSEGDQSSTLGERMSNSIISDQRISITPSTMMLKSSVHPISSSHLPSDKPNQPQIVKKDSNNSKSETLLGSFSFDLPPQSSTSLPGDHQDSLLERITKNDLRKPGGSLLAKSLIKRQELKRSSFRSSTLISEPSSGRSKLISRQRLGKVSPPCSGFVIDFGLTNDQLDGNQIEQENENGNQSREGGKLKVTNDQEEMIWFICETVIPSYAS